MIQTVEKNKSSFKKRELILADEAIKLYHAVGRPGYKTFIDLLTFGNIYNCPISSQDANNAFEIYGADEGALKGETVSTTPATVQTETLYQPTPDII